MIQLFVLLCFFLSPSLALADPVITGVSGTTTLTVSGSGFGTHSGLVGIQWLGTNIEAGTIGEVFSPPAGWAVDGETAGLSPQKYSSTRAHSGTKSLLSDFSEVADYNSGISYDFGSTQTSIYATWWTYFDWAGAEHGQWKIWRLSQDASLYTDITTLYMSSQWWNEDGTDHQSYYIYWNEDSTQQTTYISTAENRIYRNQWVRVEVYGVPDPGGPSGVLKYNVHNQSIGVSETANLSNLNTRDGLRAFFLQNYWGNITNGTGTETKVYNDDVFVQASTQARVEICEESTWVTRQHCEIQIPSAWATGEITVTTNQGGFDSLEGKYIYVVDSTGAVNADGYLYTSNPDAPQSETPTLAYSVTGASVVYSTTGVVMVRP